MSWLIVWIPLMVVVSEEWHNCPTWFAVVSAFVLMFVVESYLGWDGPWFDDKDQRQHGRHTP